MSTLCYYCQKNDATGYPVINPMTRQVEATCRVCEYEFRLLVEDRKRFAVLSIAGKVLMALAIVLLFAVGWEVALVTLVAGSASSVVAISAVGRRANERDRKAGSFAKENGLFSLYADRPEPSQLAWCRNCAHFREISGWEGLGGIYGQDVMPPANCLPCKLLPTTEPTWERFFAVPSGKKRLYPSDCPCFERSTRG